jgi:deazaflavin-dependent oxidoreductase (nitroreductase family)
MMPDVWKWIKFKAIPAFTALGLTHGTVTLEVVGRRSGKVIRLSVTRVRLEDESYLVSLGGESQWVQNVRAAGGAATIVSGRRASVELMEIPTDERAPILLAYVNQRAFTHSGAQSARHFFGFQSPPTLEDMARVAAGYPVFKICQPGQEPSSA